MSGALLAALDAGRPGMAAVDVFEKEPLTDSSDPLIYHPRVIATPHIGYVTYEKFDLQFSDVFGQINAYAAGRPIKVVNAEAMAQYGTVRFAPKGNTLIEYGPQRSATATRNYRTT